MVQCNGCRYLQGYTEYGHDYIYCDHPQGHPTDDDLINDTEKEINCLNWQSIHQTEPHSFYMNWYNQMIIRLEG